MGDAIRVWDLANDREMYTNRKPGRRVSGTVAFSTDGKRLVTEGDECIDVWDARSGRELQSLKIKPGGIPSMSFSPDGKRLAVAVWHDKSAKILAWEGDKLAEVRTLQVTFDRVVTFAGSVARSGTHTLRRAGWRRLSVSPGSAHFRDSRRSFVR